jgi:hypothetical protein
MDVPWTNYRMLDKQGIHIVVAKNNGGYKLVFWENLNKLIRDNKGN